MSDQVPAPLPTTPPELPGGRASSPATWLVSLVLASMLGALLFAGGYLAAGGAQREGTCAAPT